MLTLYAAERGYFDEQAAALLLEMAMDVAFALEVADHERERMAAEEAQHSAEERLRLAVHAGNVGLGGWDLQTNQVYYSPGGKGPGSYTHLELPAKGVVEVLGGCGYITKKRHNSKRQAVVH